MRHHLVSPLRQHPTSANTPLLAASVSSRFVASPAGAVAKVAYYFREVTSPRHLRTLAFCICLFCFRVVNHEDSSETAQDRRPSFILAII